MAPSSPNKRVAAIVMALKLHYVVCSSQGAQGTKLGLVLLPPNLLESRGMVFPRFLLLIETQLSLSVWIYTDICYVSATLFFSLGFFRSFRLCLFCIHIGVLLHNCGAHAQKVGGGGWGDKTRAYMQISIARKRERKMRMVSFRVLSSAQKERGARGGGGGGDGYQQGG
ncbi:hypothetical protein NPIL_540981 [Nephila pilipes]|uniref:Uncharacterized protein n=1 Tax=Nephila pilipes TaxID=299642 RepID=A0A8X6PKZ3_NEPPI|nr:hypothetical protein NPIL_540981 [Nephila pilipes]